MIRIPISGRRLRSHAIRSQFQSCRGTDWKWCRVWLESLYCLNAIPSTTPSRAQFTEVFPVSGSSLQISTRHPHSGSPSPTSSIARCVPSPRGSRPGSRSDTFHASSSCRFTDWHSGFRESPATWRPHPLWQPRLDNTARHSCTYAPVVRPHFITSITASSIPVTARGDLYSVLTCCPRHSARARAL